MTQKQFAGAAPLAHLAGGITGTPSTFTVDNAAGYPDGSIGPFVVDIDRNLATEEKILCSSRSTNTLTIQTRGWDGTVSQNHSNGATVEHVLDADTLQEANNHVNNAARDDHSQYLNVARHDITGRHGPTVVLHGSTGNLSNDDHTQYLRTDASRIPSSHGSMFAAPVGLGVANADGTLKTFPSSDHVHKAGLIITTSARTGLTLAAGDTFYETDTKLFWYYDGTNVHPLSEATRTTKANVSSLHLNAGALVYETDTNHLVGWNGTAILPIYGEGARVHVHRIAAFSASATPLSPVLANFDTTDWDVASAYSSGTTYTAPLAGFVEVKMRLGLTTTASGQYCVADVYKNGSQWVRGPFSDVATGVQEINATISETVQVAAGDTLQLFYSASAASLSGVTGATNCYASYDFMP